GVRERDNFHSLVHPSAYYTLNNIPTGAKLTLTELSTANSSLKKEEPKQEVKTPAKQEAAKAPEKEAEAPSFEVVSPILAKNTCSACHNTDTRQVGPSFQEIAKRNYTVDQIVELVVTPRPENWPDYSTPMPPMPHVPKNDVIKIAEWIRSLNNQ